MKTIADYKFLEPKNLPVVIWVKSSTNNMYLVTKITSRTIYFDILEYTIPQCHDNNMKWSADRIHWKEFTIPTYE
jgi:hypothetical protein